MTDRSSAPLRMTTTWGNRQIGYVLMLEPRRNLVITVHPDLRVQVRAPDARPLEHVLRRIHARRAWIAHQLREFEQVAPLPPPRFISGETLLYLGREYRLRVERNGRGVSLQSGRFVVRVSPSASRRAVRSAVLRWFRLRARKVFQARVSRLQRETSMLSELKPQLRVRTMSRRWGSCSARGAITMNPALLQASPSCVDYVLAHELVHLLEPAHSPRFYRIMNRVMRDWPQRRERLARAAVRWY